jgi:hypothetical protein
VDGETLYESWAYAEMAQNSTRLMLPLALTTKRAMSAVATPSVVSMEASICHIEAMAVTLTLVFTAKMAIFPSTHAQCMSTEPRTIDNNSLCQSLAFRLLTFTTLPRPTALRVPVHTHQRIQTASAKPTDTVAKALLLTTPPGVVQVACPTIPSHQEMGNEANPTQTEGFGDHLVCAR